MQLEDLHSGPIYTQGIIDIVRIRIFLAKNLSWLIYATIDITVRDRKPHLIGWSMRITLDVT